MSAEVRMLRRVVTLKAEFSSAAGVAPTRLVLAFGDAERFAAEMSAMPFVSGDKCLGMLIEVRDVAATYVCGEPRIEVERAHRARARA